MPNLAALWEYQAAELEKEALEREISSTPARIKFNKLHNYLIEQQNAIRRTQKEIEQKQQALVKLNDETDALLSRVELEHSEFENMKADADCTAEEMTECRESHERLLGELFNIRRTIDELIKWLETALAEYKKTRTNATKAKREYDALKAVCEAEFENSKASLEAAQARVNEQAKAVDPALLERYKRVKRNHNAPVARVENNQCSGCNMSLPVIMIKRVLAGDGIVECDNCGRILYGSEQ